MLSVWTDTAYKHWRLRYCDRNGDIKTISLDLFPRHCERNEVIAKNIPWVATEYVYFLHDSENLWKKLEMRNYDLKTMYRRMSDYSPYYTIELFASDLRNMGVIPATVTQKAKSTNRNLKRHAKRNFVERKKKYEYKGAMKTITEWAAESGIPKGTLKMRLTRGWDIGAALHTPIIERSETGRIGADRRWSKKRSKKHNK